MGENKQKSFFEFTSAGLHILAMALMLSDHLWATFFWSQRWMTAIGRIAFPIFAFMIVEGYYHTSNVKKYMKRMLIFALIAEIPFNLMMSGRFIGPFHQNVLWTFLLAMLLMRLLDKIRSWIAKWASYAGSETVRKVIIFVLTAVAAGLVCYVGYFIGNITFVDYFGAGILTVLVFYLFHGRKWWNFLLQLACIFYINAELLAGMTYSIPFFGHSFDFPEQAIAIFSLLPIWLYKGKKGYHSKPFQYFCYAFYPAHMLVLVLIYKIFS